MFTSNGAFDLQVDRSIVAGTGGGSFVNNGSFTKSGATGTSGVSVGFTNSNTGIINANSGTLSLTGGGSYDGALNVAGVATLNLGGGTHSFNAGSTMAGTGTVVVSAGRGAGAIGSVVVVRGPLPDGRGSEDDGS